MVLPGESPFSGAVGGRLFSDLPDLLLPFDFLTESLRERLFLLSDRERFFIELLLVKDDDLAASGDSVLFLPTETLFFDSDGDHVDDVAREEVGLNLEYFVGSSIRSD